MCDFPADPESRVFNTRRERVKRKEEKEKIEETRHRKIDMLRMIIMVTPYILHFICWSNTSKAEAGVSESGAQAGKAKKRQAKGGKIRILKFLNSGTISTYIFRCHTRLFRFDNSGMRENWNFHIPKSSGFFLQFTLTFLINFFRFLAEKLKWFWFDSGSFVVVGRLLAQVLSTMQNWKNEMHAIAKKFWNWNETYFCLCRRL